MRKQLLGLLLVLHAAQTASSAFERQPSGPRLAALGGTGVGLPAELWGARVNPAGCAGLPEAQCGWGVSPGLYGFPELKRQEAVVGVPWGGLVFPVCLSRFGFDLYGETVIGSGVGGELAPSFRAGVLLNLCHLAIRGYGSSWTAGVDAGLQWDPADEITLGCSAANLYAPPIGGTGEPLPRTISAGLDYRPVPGCHLLLDAVKDVRFPLELHLGIEYTLLNLLALRGGMVDDPPFVTGGVGILWGILEVDYALTVHDVLGETHEFGLRLHLGAW
jgi:hypothetical protein